MCVVEWSVFDSLCSEQVRLHQYKYHVQTEENKQNIEGNSSPEQQDR